MKIETITATDLGEITQEQTTTIRVPATPVPEPRRAPRLLVLSRRSR